MIELIEKIVEVTPRDMSCVESITLYHMLDKTLEQARLYKDDNLILKMMQTYFIERKKNEYTQRQYTTRD